MIESGETSVIPTRWASKGQFSSVKYNDSTGGMCEIAL